MGEVFVDRLTLRLPPMPTWEARRLAELVSQGLATANVAASSATKVRARVDAKEGLGTERLARLIVAEVLRQIGANS